ncbi:GNAT family N-acetyltransferase [Schlesneria paludicola]|uniref:GNAT family N-acetyltransferase n=1 Tax=Schlesneria paludicola TaxID=360056 RepID=UPI000680B911
MVTLRDLTRDNWVECARLALDENQQGNLASNIETIAESKFEEHHRLRAIYHGDRLVGLLAYTREDDPPDEELFWIFRLMVDKDYQRQGIGLAAMQLAIGEIAELGASRIRTMHKPTNRAAASLYRNLGFREIGFLDDGDVLLEMRLTPTRYDCVDEASD